MATEPTETLITTQLTSKRFKIAQLVAVALICFGVVSCVAKEPGTSAVLLMTGFAIYLYARVGAWWRNG